MVGMCHIITKSQKAGKTKRKGNINGIYNQFQDKEVIKMWVIFLLSALGYAVLALLVLWIGNKVINAIKKENSKVDKILKNESEEK